MLSAWVQGWTARVAQFRTVEPLTVTSRRHQWTARLEKQIRPLKGAVVTSVTAAKLAHDDGHHSVRCQGRPQLCPDRRQVLWKVWVAGPIKLRLPIRAWSIGMG